MLCDIRCPDPGDKQGWRDWTKCWLIACAVLLAVVGVVFLLKAL